jgi:ubiquinone/menaquinone biosynthesis C-methylase UbiE
VTNQEASCVKTETLAVLETERVRRFYNRYAEDYDSWMQPFDRLLLGDGRRRTCARASGRTLELAIGTGRNLAYYPREVQLTGIDLSSAMLTLAGRQAQALGRIVELRLGNAHALDFPDNCFDTLVCTLALCTIPDERRALTEAYRVLRPNGQLLLLEHVRSPVGPVRWGQRLLDPLLTRLTSDHLLRDPVDHLEAVGFRLELCEHTKWGLVVEIVARKGATPSALGTSESVTQA